MWMWISVVLLGLLIGSNLAWFEYRKNVNELIDLLKRIR